MRNTIIIAVLWLITGIAGLNLLATYGNKRPIGLLSAIVMVGSGPAAFGVGAICFLIDVAEKYSPCVFNCDENK